MKLRMKKKTILLIALAMAMLLALPSSAFASDEMETECPPRPSGMYQNMRYMQRGRCGEFIFTEKLCEEEDDSVFGQWYGVNYPTNIATWTHEFPFYDMPNCEILSVQLTIDAFDVDYPKDSEKDVIRVDGIKVGRLEGSNQATSASVFVVPIETLTDDGIANVKLKVVNDHLWHVRLDCSELVVTFTREGYMYRRTMPICLD